jgi:hypothetical protein
MTRPLQILIMGFFVLLIIFVGGVWPALQKRKTNKAFSEVLDVMEGISFNESKYTTDQLKVILSRIAKRIYIPSWYTEEDINSLFIMHGIKVEHYTVVEIFDRLIDSNDIVDTVTSALWDHVHNSLKIGE